MLCINKYTQEYIDQCRSKVDQQLAAYKELKTAVRNQKEVNGVNLNASLDSFEPLFFNNMVLVLDIFFTDRSRAIEGKDGNPLNEVRVLCNSML